jgi:hypothetical protein
MLAYELFELQRIFLAHFLHILAMVAVAVVSATIQWLPLF